MGNNIMANQEKKNKRIFSESQATKATRPSEERRGDDIHSGVAQESGGEGERLRGTPVKGPPTASPNKEEDGRGEEGEVRLTPLAAERTLQIMKQENLSEGRLRIKVVGGGCAGFSYDMSFDEGPVAEEGPTAAAASDEVLASDMKFVSFGVTFVVDQMSLMYLRGTEIDYVETLQGAGFKFNNPNVTHTCGCGSSFQA